MLPYFGPEWEQYMRAASGDLLVVECKKPPAGETGPSLYEMFGDVSTMICDFSTMTCARLPEPVVLPERWYGYTFVMLGQCGEDNAGAYKVAIMDLTHYTDQANGKPYSFQVYSSVTQRWKELHPDATSEFKFGALINCIFLFEKVFCLLRVGPKEQCFHEILAFDTNTEKYEVKMIIPDSDLMTGKKQQKKKKSDLLFPENHEKPASLKLVAANGRLHLTGWIGHREFLVFEVDLANKQLIKVAELPKSLRQGLTCVNVQVDGHKECIFLYPSKGDNIIYDFSRKTWRVLRNRVIGGLALSKFEFSIEGDE